MKFSRQLGMWSSPDPSECNRRRFSKEEDEKLRRLIRQYGTHAWGTVSSYMTDRTARQCRHRYKNYLMEGHQKLAWTPAEEELVISKHREFGPKWVRIATFLQGRSGNDVKNRWHKHITKCYPIEEIAPRDLPRDPPDSDETIVVKVTQISFEPVHGRPIGRVSKVGLSAFLRCALN
jgi:hypothetical protein